MQVAEEVEAIEAMGIGPLRFPGRPAIGAITVLCPAFRFVRLSPVF